MAIEPSDIATAIMGEPSCISPNDAPYTKHWSETGLCCGAVGAGAVGDVGDVGDVVVVVGGGGADDAASNGGGAIVVAAFPVVAAGIVEHFHSTTG